MARRDDPAAQGSPPFVRGSYVRFFDGRVGILNPAAGPGAVHDLGPDERAALKEVSDALDLDGFRRSRLEVPS